MEAVGSWTIKMGLNSTVQNRAKCLQGSEAGSLGSLSGCELSERSIMLYEEAAPWKGY